MSGARDVDPITSGRIIEPRGGVMQPLPRRLPDILFIMAE
jgi:hypothetical protein